MMEMSTIQAKSVNMCYIFIKLAMWTLKLMSFFNNLHNSWENSSIIVWINERMQIYNTNTIPKIYFVQPNILSFEDQQ